MNPYAAPTLYNSKAEIDALERAALNDARINHSSTPPYAITEYSEKSMRPLSIGQDQMIAGQRPVVAMALAENSPSKDFEKAFAGAMALHKQTKVINSQIKEVLHHSVNAEYKRLVDDATERVLAGDGTALHDLESESDISTRFEAERAALSNAKRKLAHAQIPHAVTLRYEIDAALAKMAATLESRDAAACYKFGIALEYSVTTRLVQSVRVQFHRRTFDLLRFSKLRPTDECSAVVHTMFGDFLDLSAW